MSTKMNSLFVICFIPLIMGFPLEDKNKEISAAMKMKPGSVLIVNNPGKSAGMAIRFQGQYIYKYLVKNKRFYPMSGEERKHHCSETPERIPVNVSMAFFGPDKEVFFIRGNQFCKRQLFNYKGKRDCPFWRPLKKLFSCDKIKTILCEDNGRIDGIIADKKDKRMKIVSKNGAKYQIRFNEDNMSATLIDPNSQQVSTRHDSESTEQMSAVVQTEEPIIPLSDNNEEAKNPSIIDSSNLFDPIRVPKVIPQEEEFTEESMDVMLKQTKAGNQLITDPIVTTAAAIGKVSPRHHYESTEQMNTVDETEEPIIPSSDKKGEAKKQSIEPDIDDLFDDSRFSTVIPQSIINKNIDNSFDDIRAPLVKSQEEEEEEEFTEPLMEVMPMQTITESEEHSTTAGNQRIIRPIVTTVATKQKKAVVKTEQPIIPLSDDYEEETTNQSIVTTVATNGKQSPRHNIESTKQMNTVDEKNVVKTEQPIIPVIDNEEEEATNQSIDPNIDNLLHPIGVPNMNLLAEQLTEHSTDKMPTQTITESEEHLTTAGNQQIIKPMVTTVDEYDEDEESPRHNSKSTEQMSNVVQTEQPIIPLASVIDNKEEVKHPSIIDPKIDNSIDPIRVPKVIPQEEEEEFPEHSLDVMTKSAVPESEEHLTTAGNKRIIKPIVPTVAAIGKQSPRHNIESTKQMNTVDEREQPIIAFSDKKGEAKKQSIDPDIDDLFDDSRFSTVIPQSIINKNIDNSFDDIRVPLVKSQEEEEEEEEEYTEHSMEVMSTQTISQEDEFTEESMDAMLKQTKAESEEHSTTAGNSLITDPKVTTVAPKQKKNVVKTEQPIIPLSDDYEEEATNQSIIDPNIDNLLHPIKVPNLHQLAEQLTEHSTDEMPTQTITESEEHLTTAGNKRIIKPMVTTVDEFDEEYETNDNQREQLNSEKPVTKMNKTRHNSFQPRKQAIDDNKTVDPNAKTVSKQLNRNNGNNNPIPGEKSRRLALNNRTDSDLRDRPQYTKIIADIVNRKSDFTDVLRAIQSGLDNKHVRGRLLEPIEEDPFEEDH